MCVYLKFFTLKVLWFCILCTFTKVTSKNTECGTLEDKSKIPWVVGIYLEQEKDSLELICLGTLLKDHYVITAAQCVCESLSNKVRKEHIFVSTEFQKQLKISSNVFRVKTKDVISRSDYEGFLLKPISDLAILKLDNPQKIGFPVCVDWSDFNFRLEEGATGIVPSWQNQLKTLETTYLDYDSCALSASEDFSHILGHDKKCFKVSASDLAPESIGAGTYFKNPKDSKWYFEGIVSGKEKSSDGVYVAATSIRQYLPWLSRVCS